MTSNDEKKNEKVNADAAETEGVDYLHPEGKPAVSAQQLKADKEERQKPVDQKSIDEADGHHVCTNECKHEQQKKS